MIKLAEIFSDNMMLQRGLKTLVYGEGNNGKGYIKIQDKTLEFVCENGKFEVVLPELKAGDNFDNFCRYTILKRKEVYMG